MNSSALKFFKNDQNFKGLIILDKSFKDFEDLKKKADSLPRAWYELSHLTIKDRIEFSRDFVLKVLPYIPHVYSFIFDFFSYLEDISIILTKKNENDSYIPQLVYLLKNSDVFYRGFPPAAISTINDVNNQFKNLLPVDYLNFAKIHSGFCKNEDTGVFKIEILKSASEEFQNLIVNKDKSIKAGSRFIDSKSLIPFYQCYSKDAFQCFNMEWFPKGEVGNVYYSGSDNAISDYHNNLSWSENLAFPTFLDWLIFYLDAMDLK